MKPPRPPWMPFAVLCACSLVSFFCLQFMQTMECKQIPWVSVSIFYPKESWNHDIVTYYLFFFTTLSLIPIMPYWVIRYCASEDRAKNPSVCDIVIITIMYNLLSLSQVVLTGMIAHQSHVIDFLWGFYMLKRDLFRIHTPGAPQMLPESAQISMMTKETLDCKLIYNQWNNKILAGLYFFFVVVLIWDTVKFFFDLWFHLELDISYNRKVQKSEDSNLIAAGVDDRMPGRPALFNS